MSSEITKIEQSRNILMQTLEAEKEYVRTVLAPEQAEEFKMNYMELSNNSYLMEKIPPKEILISATNATAFGLNVNPLYRECHILPFNVKNRGLVASLVVSKNGHVQNYFQSGFFIQDNRIWDIDGNVKAESEMTRKELMQLKTTDINFVKNHLVGWEFLLSDLVEDTNTIKVPDQKTFVGIDFVMEVTNQIQSPQYAIQTWEHKAYRRASREFFVPRSRKKTMMDKVDRFNTILETEVVRKEPNQIDVNPLANISKETLNKEVQEVEVQEVQVYEDKTVNDIKQLYKDADRAKRARMATILEQHLKYREYDQDNINSLYAELESV